MTPIFVGIYSFIVGAGQLLFHEVFTCGRKAAAGHLLASVVVVVLVVGIESILPLCVTGFALPTMGYRLCVTGYALPTMRYRLCVTGYALRAMHYGLCTTDYALRTMTFITLHSFMHYALLCFAYNVP